LICPVPVGRAAGCPCHTNPDGPPNALCPPPLALFLVGTPPTPSPSRPLRVGTRSTASPFLPHPPQPSTLNPIVFVNLLRDCIKTTSSASRTNQPLCNAFLIRVLLPLTTWVSLSNTATILKRTPLVTTNEKFVQHYCYATPMSADEFNAKYDVVTESACGPQRSYCSGPFVFLRCGRCGDLVSTQPREDSSCRCGVVGADVEAGRLCVQADTRIVSASPKAAESPFR
jgi:hypothetical protein